MLTSRKPCRAEGTDGTVTVASRAVVPATYRLPRSPPPSEKGSAVKKTLDQSQIKVRSAMPSAQYRVGDYDFVDSGYYNVCNPDPSDRCHGRPHCNSDPQDSCY
jgi:hypothetical protein